jgi:uncharacterized LabA/DUF88 family protein
MAAFFVPTLPNRPRANVYVDGFNLYYGALRGSPHRWLNLERYFVALRQADDVHRIHYFTARVSPVSSTQDTYLRALMTLPRVNIIEGKFKNREIRCRVSACTHAGSRTVIVPTEKRTDVNIALQMLDDAYQERCDTLVVVSGDSDLVPALEMVKSRCSNKRLVVYVPTRDPRRGAAAELRNAADVNRSLPLALLAKAQFPGLVPDGRGGTILRPPGW